MEAKFISFENKRINLSHCAQYELVGDLIVFYGNPIYDEATKRVDNCPVIDQWRFNSEKSAKEAMREIDNSYVVKILFK